MAKNVIPRKLEMVVEMLQVIQNGDDLYAGETYALTAELRQKTDDVLNDIENAKMDSVAKQGIKEETVQRSRKMLKNARSVISRTKSFLVSQMPELQKDRLLQGYLLEDLHKRGFNDSLRTLKAIVQENGNQAGEAWELPAAVLTDASDSRDEMAQVQIEVEASKGAFHEANQLLRNSTYLGQVNIRRVREYLYAVLPEGKRDMKLKEFGLDPWD